MICVVPCLQGGEEAEGNGRVMRREGSVAGRLREVGEERSNIVYNVGGRVPPHLPRLSPKVL